MRNLSKTIVRFVKAEDGPTAVEYAVMLALIVAVCVTAVTTLGRNSKTTYSTVGARLATGS